VLVKESLVVDACIRWLLYHGCFVKRNNTGAYKPEGSNRFIRFGYKGSADIEGLTRSGRFIAVECKSDRGTLTEHQQAYAERIKAHNGLWILARSTDDLEKHKDEILKG